LKSSLLVAVLVFGMLSPLLLAGAGGLILGRFQSVVAKNVREPGTWITMGLSALAFSAFTPAPGASGRDLCPRA